MFDHSHLTAASCGGGGLDEYHAAAADRLRRPLSGMSLSRPAMGKEVVLFVVLDTSVFCRDFLLRGKAFQILLESLTCVPARLGVPEVVLDEVVTKCSEALQDRIQASVAARDRLQKLLFNVPAITGPLYRREEQCRITQI
jgi:hypothetical protein